MKNTQRLTMSSDKKNPGVYFTILVVSGCVDPYQGYLISTFRCADCHYQGGVTTKPAFWP